MPKQNPCAGLDSLTWDNAIDIRAVMKFFFVTTGRQCISFQVILIVQISARSEMTYFLSCLQFIGTAAYILGANIGKKIEMCTIVHRFFDYIGNKYAV